MGIGNKELNKVSNSSLVLQCHLFSLPNKRGGMSIMEISLPAIWSGVIGHVPCNFRQSASALIMLADTSNPQVARRQTHPTMGELLLNRATFFSRRFPHTASITSHRNSKPAILRSKLDITFCMVFIFDVLRPFPSKYSRGACFVFPEYNTTNAM